MYFYRLFVHGGLQLANGSLCKNSGGKKTVVKDNFACCANITIELCQD